MTHSDAVTDFLPYTTSQKSVSLIIAASEAAAEVGREALESNGYRALAHPRDLEAEGLRYARISKENAKEMYDLAAQYGTGQITIYDNVSHQNTWINPHYSNAALVFVVTKSDVESIESAGLLLRAVAGISTQIIV